MNGWPLVVGCQDENAGQEEARDEDQQCPTPQSYSPHRLDGDALGQHRRRASVVVVDVSSVISIESGSKTKMSHV